MKSPKLKEFIDVHYRPNEEGGGLCKYNALYALNDFLEKYPGSNYRVVFTKNRLYEVFKDYFSDSYDIEDFIGELNYKYPFLLKPRYFFEDDRLERVTLEASDVFKYISKRSNLDPISGLPSDSIEEYIFVEYVLNEEAVEND
ncbi:hypothetical protein B0H98_10879 [Vreelandella songnenensis]|uniref:Uncharacterized protein n=1 Tax=Vreelandella songnenensis TaxID=1176243 RepID=A0A2T0V004_9GAMM|nr:hypothetical protein [Halomonas songnenensis]PRY63484.1 hypothetical protein B0H98_10879 [Halomonas songnenensis]